MVGERKDGEGCGRVWRDVEGCGGKGGGLEGMQGEARTVCTRWEHAHMHTTLQVSI